MTDFVNDIGATAEVSSVDTALATISRAEIDIQISTAHRFPRSMSAFKRRAIEMATLDEDTAASCIYSRPVGDGKFAEGLSVRMAEIVGASYGNLRVGAMIIEQTDRFVKARGFAHDLETNFASASEVIESTVDKNGRPYSERMRVVVAKACVAKARRDATFQVVPKALCKPVETEARKVALGDASTLAERRSQVMKWIGKLGIDAMRVFAAMGVTGEADIGLDQLAILTGLKTAIKDGEITVDEAFPIPHVEGAPASALNDRLKNKTQAKPVASTPVTKPDAPAGAARGAQIAALKESTPETRTEETPNGETEPTAPGATPALPDPCPKSWIDDMILMKKPPHFTTGRAAKDAFHVKHAPDSWEKMSRDRHESMYQALLDGTIWT